jgi:putative hydrolase of the HAD superfamily
VRHPQTRGLTPGSDPFHVEALLFDLGGVLIEIRFERALAHWGACAGMPVDAIRPRFAFDETLARYERGEIGAAAYFASLRQSLGIDIPDEDFALGWNAIFVDEIPGVSALLRSVEPHAPLYVFSNTNEDHQREWSTRFAGLLTPFRTVFVSNELGKRKPTPEAFHAVAQAMDVPPERILFFDDTPANVEGALAVGMQAVHVRSIDDVAHALSQCQWSNYKENLR